ncbi:MAG: glycoside hydrolase family 25 protein [Ruminococcus sp.]|nr:glycoside hydrolase family 25 protein [Ruminococcus sp.]
MNNQIVEDTRREQTSAYINPELPEKNKRNKDRKIISKIKLWFNPAVAVLLVITLVLTGAVCVMSGKLSEHSKIHRAIYDKSQTIQVAGETDRIPLTNYGLGDIAIPAIEGVPLSTYKDENFVTDDKGFKHYYQDGELCSYVGIDVSAYNGDIDWQAVKASGVDFVMLRIGGRGYGAEGVMYEDSYFKSNLRGAKAAGLMVGAYFFSQAVSAQEAVEEAEYALSLIGRVSLDYPVAFDWEIMEGVDEARTENISPQTLTDCARVFCDRIKKAGYTPALYTGSQLAYYKYDLGQLSDIDIWYAFYNDTPALYYNYMIWQYSCTGQVSGIQGDVDLNICFKNYK